MSKISKEDFIITAVKVLVVQGIPWTFRMLAKMLNKEGYKTTAGTNYSETNPRGTAKMVADLCKKNYAEGNIEISKNISEIITDQNGNNPWKK